ncbi:MAG TPA: indole-3-glycerol phosphate synthase TrpC [Solirubrobacterales bacterium]|nr:indole-3-glycerol phosphate synthase TrpC [Solirubrobacterales bacterium]
MGIIDELIDGAREGVDARRREVPQAALEAQLAGRGEDRPFQEALVRPGLSLIAEFKRRSPSAGDIAPDADIGARVGAYERGGAAALSVLTDAPHFGGSLEDLRAARAAATLPIIRKDFIVDPYQLYEAAVNGADAVLLIVRALSDRELRALYEEARALDLDCLVEVHDGEELERALEADAEVIGINNRDLDEQRVDIQTTYELMPDVPAGKTVVAESGISGREELMELDRVGVDAVLIGGALMLAADPEAKARELTGADETREHRY